MNIVHIVLGKANPNRMNGVNKIAHKLATSQKNMGHEVAIFGLSNTGSNEEIERNYSLLLFKRKKFLLDSELVKKILEQPAQRTVFHIHGAFIIDFSRISRVLVRNSYRYIFTSHGAYNKEALKKNALIKRIYFRFFEKYLLTNAWKVQFGGDGEFLHIDNLISKINKVLIPNGHINEEPNLNVQVKKHNGVPVFGFVGRINIQHKGLDILLNAFLNYKLAKGRGVLWMVGDGPDLIELKSFASNHSLDESIVFYGSKYGSEKLNLITKMDVFIHTSRFEGFPMAVLEAAGLSRPLLVSEGTSFGEYVRKFECGIVLLKNDAEEVKEKLIALDSIIQTDEIEEMSKNADRMIKNEFSWDQISSKLIGY